MDEESYGFHRNLEVEQNRAFLCHKNHWMRLFVPFSRQADLRLIYSTLWGSPTGEKKGIIMPESPRRHSKLSHRLLTLCEWQVKSPLCSAGFPFNRRTTPPPSGRSWEQVQQTCCSSFHVLEQLCDKHWRQILPRPGLCFISIFLKCYGLVSTVICQSKRKVRVKHRRLRIIQNDYGKQVTSTA